MWLDRRGLAASREWAENLKASLNGLMKREEKIISAARAPNATAESIKAAMRG
jgi:hypothetical protein